MEFIISKVIYNIFILYIIIPQIKSDGECTLTGRPKADPYPSLLKCYKYNNEACCMSVHDDAIESYINQIFSPSCVRKFPLFEILMCFGCHPNENKYIEGKNIRICRSFAENLWGGDLNSPSRIFDQCGFKTDFLEEDADIGNNDYIIPSKEFDNFTHFFQYIKIPFYNDYNISIIEEENDLCYQYDKYIDNFFVFIYLFLFCFLVIL